MADDSGTPEVKRTSGESPAPGADAATPRAGADLTSYRAGEITRAVQSAAAGSGKPTSGRAVPPRSPRQALAPDEVPLPPRRASRRSSRRARNPFVVIGSAFMTLFVVLGLLAVAAITIGQTQINADGPLDRDKVVNISRNLGIRDIGELLAREGVLEQPLMFVAAVIALNARGDLKAGEYLFPRAASIKDVVGIMVDGKAISHSITIPEGLTSEQIVNRLTENEVLLGQVREMPKEGTLLPETYRFNRGMTREQLLQRMQQDQRRVVQEAWAKRAPDLPLKTPEELVTLASIVEKETGKSDERARVAGVFVNRLNRRMRLESDPTIIYGLVGGRGSLGRGILASEIRKPTPYNTYVIEGLPPGPIANPGRAAIEATANPARHRDIFFVADGTGGHAFAETLEQHNRNVQRWREIERGQAAPASAPAVAPAAATPIAPARPAVSPRPANQGQATQGQATQGQVPAPASPPVRAQ